MVGGGWLLVGGSWFIYPFIFIDSSVGGVVLCVVRLLHPFVFGYIRFLIFKRLPFSICFLIHFLIRG